jgi:hypothetical protein
MGRANSPSEPELNIRGLTARSYKTAFHITILQGYCGGKATLIMQAKPNTLYSMERGHSHGCFPRLARDPSVAIVDH